MSTLDLEKFKGFNISLDMLVNDVFKFILKCF